MIFRQLTSTGDWTFGQGVAGYAVQQAAIELNVRTRLLSWLGDCFFALRDGVDWHSRLDKGQQAALQSELKSTILQSFGVTGVNTVFIAFDTVSRKFRITYDIQTIYSPSFINSIEQATGLSGT